MPNAIDLVADHQALSAVLGHARPFLIVSPPRSCSTALARALGQHSRIGPYYHEPCGLDSYEHLGVQSIINELDGCKPGSLIKEMTFQFRNLEQALCFFRHAGQPPVFLLREPLLTLESRIRMVLGDLAGDKQCCAKDAERIAQGIANKDYSALGDLLTEEVFPLARSGWHDLGEQMAACRRQGIEFIVMRASQFRQQPALALEQLCHYWGLDFETGMLRWQSQKQSPDGALTRHDAWYAKVAASEGVLAAEALDRDAVVFPERFRQHLPQAQAVYNAALNDNNVI